MYGTQDPRSRSRLPAAGTIACWNSAPRPPPANGVSGGSVGRLPGGSEKQLGLEGQAGAEEGSPRLTLEGARRWARQDQTQGVSGQDRSQREAPKTAGPCSRPWPPAEVRDPGFLPQSSDRKPSEDSEFTHSHWLFPTQRAEQGKSPRLNEPHAALLLHQWVRQTGSLVPVFHT